jgi:hypothetical protein
LIIRKEEVECIKRDEKDSTGFDGRGSVLASYGYEIVFRRLKTVVGYASWTYTSTSELGPREAC